MIETNTIPEIYCIEICNDEVSLNYLVQKSHHTISSQGDIRSHLYPNIIRISAVTSPSTYQMYERITIVKQHRRSSNLTSLSSRSHGTIKSAEFITLSKPREERWWGIFPSQLWRRKRIWQFGIDFRMYWTDMELPFCFDGDGKIRYRDTHPCANDLWYVRGQPYNNNSC